MCGIAGYLNYQAVEFGGKKILQHMISMLTHRGPDGVGFYVDEKVGFAHARLSIIDLATGGQPIHNEDETIWVIFNGEIFNFIELRKELAGKGHRFYTKTDTEVIVHAYEEYGEDFVQKLNGQFSIALWDKNQQSFFLIRDRVGIVPLFYSEQNGTLLFASEAKSIIAAATTAPHMNHRSLDQLMTFWAPVSPGTMFDNIQEVRPGEMLKVRNGRVSKHLYWDWVYPVDAEYLSGSEMQLADQLHDLLIDATTLRLRSDVPVGAYLSGGLDSSIIVAIIHHFGGVPLRTFSIGFEDSEYDEGAYQNMLIEHLGTKHSRIQCNDAKICEQFLQTIWHTESPILRTAPVPMRLLSGLVRDNNYKVVLTGEGADEVFGGYDIFKEGKIRQFWAKNTNSDFRPLLLKRLYPYLDISKKGGHRYLKQFFGLSLDQFDSPFFSHFPRWETTSKIKEFFSASLKDELRSNATEALSDTLHDAINQWHPFNKSQYVESKGLMSGYLLCSQGDRMLLSNSVEGRFPFLDHRVIEFANGLHPNFKMKVLNEKYLLKKSFNRYLPKKIINRYKQPYRAPDIPSFFGEGDNDYVNELMDSSKISDYGYFDPDRTRLLMKKISKGRAIGYKDNMAFVGILSTQAWHYHFIENFSANLKNTV